MHLTTVIILLIANIGLADPDPGSKPKKKTGNWKKPEFDETLPDNITVMEGDTASLPCVVSRLRGRSVSWIRQSDLHVISANELTFTTDDRFRVVIDNLTSSFSLEVISALRNDSGVYECQVNTRPKLSRPITLNVQVPSAKIQGPSDLYIKSGSTLVISCTALLHPDANGTRFGVQKRVKVGEELGEIEENRAHGTTRKQFQGIKRMRNGFQPRMSITRIKEGNVIIGKEEIQRRWIEHFKELSNRPSPHNPVNDMEIEGNIDNVEAPTIKQLGLVI
ncbi:neurotrimin-like [Palaemon carinicauda]|uniref:neurotrimin-like n=1 Tax=Palaemon carinicauda TaxID=392227 RepID=UPI0035B5F640